MSEFSNSNLSILLKTIETLDLSGNNINEEGALKITLLMLNKGVENVLLRKCRLSEESLRYLLGNSSVRVVIS